MYKITWLERAYHHIWWPVFLIKKLDFIWIFQYVCSLWIIGKAKEKLHHDRYDYRFNNMYIMVLHFRILNKDAILTLNSPTTVQNILLRKRQSQSIYPSS